MGSSREDQPILVAVANPDHVEQLVRTASDLARTGPGRIQIVSVAVKPSSSPFSLYSDQAIIERFAEETRNVVEQAGSVAPDDVEIDREVVVGRSVADGVLRAISHTDPRAVVIGWHGERTRTDAILGTNLDRLITNATCDLYVERVGYEADGVDSVLVPVAGGPHVRPAVAAAKAIAAGNNATVSLRSVVGPDGDDDAAQGHVETASRLLEDAPGPEVATETLVQPGDDVADTIVSMATDHDILIFGLTRRSALQRRLLGSIPQRVIGRTERTVLLSRAGDVIGRPRIGRLRRLWHRS